MHHSLARVLALSIALGLPRSARAQTDSAAVTPVTPPAPESQAEAPIPSIPGFHAGQWGAAFTYNSGANGLGALHFTSADAAWVLNFEGLLGHSESSGGDAESDQSQARLLVAKRWYGLRHGRILPHSQLGLFGDWYRSKYQCCGGTSATKQ
ncbi:MAG TPA: hypothetical protein VGR13_08600, partial [Actinomycetota bacterium]|nr:hypothetical protein [Actinomycetota bacterium]